jgi:hypothetical protein
MTDVDRDEKRWGTESSMPAFGESNDHSFLNISWKPLMLWKWQHIKIGNIVLETVSLWIGTIVLVLHKWGWYVELTLQRKVDIFVYSESMKSKTRHFIYNLSGSKTKDNLMNFGNNFSWLMIDYCLFLSTVPKHVFTRRFRSDLLVTL